MKGQILIILIALSFNLADLITGIVASLKNKDLKSAKLRDGLFKKMGFFLCYALAFMVDVEGPLIGLNIGVKVLPLIVCYSVWTEIVSIIENIGKINEELLPDKLKDLFHVEGE